MPSYLRLFAQSATINSFTSGYAVTAPNYWGQSFTTPSVGPWDDLTFNFYTSPNQDFTITPIAAGTGYLFTQAYTSTLANLGSTAPGFVAESTEILNNEYVFASTVQLLPDTVYYFYEDAGLGICADPNVQSSSSYYASDTSTAFSSAGTPADFRLSGDIAAASAPEPLPGLLLLAGFCLTSIGHRRTRT